MVTPSRIRGKGKKGQCSVFNLYPSFLCLFNPLAIFKSAESFLNKKKTFIAGAPSARVGQIAQVAATMALTWLHVLQRHQY
jgi:hypothetical protein